MTETLISGAHPDMALISETLDLWICWIFGHLLFIDQ